jgi:hypothetical protein
MPSHEQLRIRLEHAVALVDAANETFSRGSVARAVRFGHQVLGEARAVRLHGDITEHTRRLLDLILTLSLRLGALEDDP